MSAHSVLARVLRPKMSRAKENLRKLVSLSVTFATHFAHDHFSTSEVDGAGVRPFFSF